MLIKKGVSNLDWRLLFLIIVPLSILLCIALSSTPSGNYFFPLRSFLFTTPSPDVADNLRQSRMAVCLVGGARRFEITGPSIMERVIKKYPKADLFLHCPMDKNAFKLSLLKTTPRLVSVRIFDQKIVPQTAEQVRVLTAANSPNGIQVQTVNCFNLVTWILTSIEFS